MPPDDQAVTHPAPWVVLDTNVVLDALLFHDARALPLMAALNAGQMRWAHLPAMLDELADVLRRPFAQIWPTSAQSVMQQARALSEAAPPMPPGCSPLRCTDRSDQIFIDLALALPARWLFTRDRALLALTKAAARRGVTVLQPSHWAGMTTSA